MTVPTPPPIPTPDTLKGVDDFIRSSLEAFSGSWFDWLLIATGVVVIGLLFEAPEIWHETVQAIRGLFHSSESERRTPAWMKLAGTVGWVLIVVGVAGEFVAESFVSKADGLVRQFDEILLSEAQKEAGAAIERASANEKEAARLGKEAEDERLARVKIEERLAWRRVSPKQFKDAVSRLSPFPGSLVYLQIVGGDPETGAFAQDILKIFQDSHWQARESQNIIQIPTPLGLTCEIDETTDAGKALAETCKVLPGASVVSGTPQGMLAFIIIGPRPPP